MLGRLTVGAFTLLAASVAEAQSPAAPTFPPDSAHWDLQGQAKVAEYQGRPCLRLDGGLAVARGFELRDGVVDADVASPAPVGFLGFQFRMTNDESNAELVYLRQHKSGHPDAIQYTPVLNTGRNWQIYTGPGFTAAVDIPKATWFHLRLEVVGATAKLYVTDTITPALVMTDLKSGLRRGQLALFVLTGETYFTNVRVQSTPDAPWVRHLPAMPAGVLTKWSLSPSFDAVGRDLERPLSRSERDSMPWQEVETEPPGFVVINRYRESPHLGPRAAPDSVTRLRTLPGTMVVYARTRIDSDRDQVKKLALGYSDEVSVFLNGRILYRGRSAQGFRDPEFLGIMNVENDAVYLPLKKGSNELILAISEVGGGWGFISRLDDLNK